MIGDYYRYTAKAEGRENFKSMMNLTKFQIKENQKHLLYCL